MTADQRRPGIEVQRLTVCRDLRTHAAADIHGVQIRAAVHEPGAVLQRGVQPWQILREVAIAEVEVQLRDLHPEGRRHRECFLEAVLVDAELARLVAGVVDALVVAGPDPRIDTDADGTSGAAFTEAPYGR